MADAFDSATLKINVLHSLNQYNTYSFTHSWNNYTSYFSENDEENAQQNLQFITVCNLADEINLKGNDDIICKTSKMEVLKNSGGHTITISIKPNMKNKFLKVFIIINNELNYKKDLSFELHSESVELIYVSDTTDSDDENHHFSYHYYSNETEEERRESRKSTKEISKYYFDSA
jgi:hypothetical protein